MSPYSSISIAVVWTLFTLGRAGAELVGHWEFDNPGNVGQATVSSDLQTVGNATYSAAGNVGGALSLDGSGDYLRVNGSDSLASGMPTGDGSYTLAAFIQTTNAARNAIIGWGNYGSAGQVNAFRTGDGVGFQALTNYGWGGGYDYVAAAGILDGNWHHVAATYDSTTSTKRLYLDGVELGAGLVLSSNLSAGSANFRIGSTNGGEFFNGLLDDMRVYDTALNTLEIDALASAAPLGGPVIQSFDATPAARFEGESSTLAWDIDGSQVSGSLNVEILAPGGAVVNSSANASGTYVLAIGDTGGVAQTWTYTLRASESGGSMISRESTIDIDVTPGIPSAEEQSLETMTTTPLPITLTGTDPNMHPNPGLTFQIISPPGGGALSGSEPNISYTANPGFTGTDTFTYRTNDGKYDSPPATVSIDVLPAPSAPTDIALSTLTIGDKVINGGFIATISTIDPNVSDTHTTSLVSGAGSTYNGLFSIVGNQLRAATDFSGLIGNTYSIRLRSTDIGGLFYEESFSLSVIEISDDVVINEIHYNPPSNTVRQEFIELFNPAEVTADISGWRLSGAVAFVIPNGTTIPADGYLVIAEDPATITSTLGAAAIGPYSGNLSGSGETIRLRDTNDNVVDDVDYKAGFPWPTAADGNGPSIELINPALDNSLGSSWRAAGFNTSPPVTYLAAADTAWHYRKGQTNNPPADGAGKQWNEQGYDESADNVAWVANVQTPLGYADGDDNTELNDMSGSYSTVYLRREFTIPASVPPTLALRLYIDDGCIAYINGNEVSRQFVSADAKNFDSLTGEVDHESSWEKVLINSAQAGIVAGTNTLAIHAINATLNSSDLSIDAEIRSPATSGNPTPGAANSSFASNAAPNIRQVNHTPTQPTASDPVLITAKITDPEGVATVTLEYQIVAPGAYIPANLPHPVPNIPTETELADNPAYETGWTTVAMTDDGNGGDALAGDDIFSTTISAQTHRSLVRYRITIEDSLSLSARVPYPDDPALNFAYFVYNGVPAYEGNSTDVMANTLPVYHLITRSEDYSECIAYNTADQIPQNGPARFFYNWKGTIVYDGIVYDNIRYRLRGANGRYQSTGKRSMRIRLNEGSFLQARDQFGKKFEQKWRTLTLGKCSSNRLTLTYGLNEAVNFYLFNKAGVPAANAGWLQWRVIDGADESPDASHGDFHGMYLFTETYDVRFLEEHDLEKGNLYKLINQTGDWAQQQRYQAAFATADGSDHDTIEQQLDGGDDAAFISAHVNLDKWNRSHALVQAIRHYDYWPSANKNMVYYFEPDYLPANNNLGKLWILPWDTDATWGPTYNAGHDVVYNALFAASGGGSDGNSTPELWPAYYNEVREIRDLLWQQDQIEPLIDEFASFIAPLEAADASRWKGTPADAGNYNGLHGPGITSLAAYAQDMKNFAFSGGNWDGGNVGAGGRASDLDSIQGQNGEAAQIPNTPTIVYTGSANYPTNGISFQCGSFTDPQGNGTFGAMEWRIAEITDPSAPKYDPEKRFKLEWESDWESGALSAFGNSISIPTTAVRSGLTYRARVRHQDNTGRWSHWSIPVQFTTTLPDISDYLAGLVISEFNYHPTDPSAAEINAGYDDDDFFEFIELKNVGITTLDLTDVRFTKGVDFDFLNSAITSLAPGAHVLVVANVAAFEMRHGTGLPVAGAWEAGDKLDNGGEQLKLSFGAGDAIRDFVYDDVSPWPTTPDGGGFSLTLINPESVPNHGTGTNWRASYAANGTPGSTEADSPLADWLAARGVTDPLAPFDDSGTTNLMAYATGMDISSSTPDISLSGDFPALSFRVRQSATDVTYIVEVSEDLVTWNSGSGFTVELGTPQDNSDGTETVTVRSLVSASDGTEQFLRLRVATTL